MPYVTPDRRAALDGYPHPGNVGDLNYLITKLCLDYMSRQPRNYQAMNDVVGALESAKLEFYRRVVAPYESDKIGLNGDVYLTPLENPQCATTSPAP